MESNMSNFNKNIEQLDSASNLILIRVFKQNNELVSVIPNLPGKQGSLKIFNRLAETEGVIDYQQAQEGLRLFAEHASEAQSSPGQHPNIDLLLSLESHDKLQIERISINIPLLLEKISERKASKEECEAFIELLNQGKVRAAEKIQGIWQPQTYVIDGILNYFGTHPSIRLENDYWDKIPLKTKNFSDQDFDTGGVRYAPGSVVRTGAYIGAGTVVMNQAFINIGAYIAGDGVMIDAATRVASCAQIGKNVKFGAGSGIEGILEPAGRLPSIIEDHAKIGAMCEVTGIVGEGAVLASGVVMASGKKIYDESTGEIVPPLECIVDDKTFLLPIIPPYRLAVGGSLLSKNGQFTTDAVILKPGDLRDTDTMKHFEKQGIIYQ